METKEKHKTRPDRVREALAARADQLGLTPYAIASLMQIDPGTVKRFLHGMQRDGSRHYIALNSRYVTEMMTLLGLEMRPKKNFKKPQK